jgi:tetratricopeptide (TPR) repeat protein
MLSKFIRLGLTAALVLWSVFQFVQGHIGNGIFLFLLAGIPLLTYFRNERILAAFWYLRKNEMDKAKKHLDAIRNPEKSLIRSQLAYYYFLQGIMESQKGVGKAETLLRKALSTGLRMKTDQAMAKLNLAGLAMAKRRKREATQLLSEAKKLDEKKMLDDQIKMLQNQLKRI